MGRKSLRDSTRDDILDRMVLEEGIDFGSAWEVAMAAADKVEAEMSERRRTQNAERQRRYRARRLKPGFYAEPGDPPIKALTIYLDENDLAILDRRAREVADIPHLRKDLPMSHWRSYVIASLLCSLDNEDREQARLRERNIVGLQECIQSSRSKGESEEDIERQVAKLGLGMTVDEIIAYQVQYASPGWTMPTIPPLDE